MVQQRKAFPFEFVITLGDNIYGGHSSSDFEQKFANPYKTLLDGGVKFYASLGNHDDASERQYKPFNMNGANYYSFKKGNAHFFALDSNYMDPKQLDWLQKELQGAGKDDGRYVSSIIRCIPRRASMARPRTSGCCWNPSL